MAASLTKLLSGMSLVGNNGISTTPKLARCATSNLMNTGSQARENQTREYSLLQSFNRLSVSELQNKSKESRLLQRQSGWTVSSRSVTYEIKQWREHRVINRFYRLHWGGWIRTRGGRFRKLYQKTPKDRWRLQQHIFCNKTQCNRLDRLVLPHWKEPKYFVDSPYEPYHQRTNFEDFPNHRKFYP